MCHVTALAHGGHIWHNYITPTTHWRVSCWDLYDERRFVGISTNRIYNIYRHQTRTYWVLGALMVVVWYMSVSTFFNWCHAGYSTDEEERSSMCCRRYIYLSISKEVYVSWVCCFGRQLKSYWTNAARSGACDGNLMTIHILYSFDMVRVVYGVFASSCIH